jgi:sugar lactone lactonase YvrE
MMDIRALSNQVSDLGEGPIWIDDRNEVMWVDIPGKKLHCSDFDSGLTRTWSFPTSICAFAENINGGYIAATLVGFAEINAHGELHPKQSFLDSNMRFNDGKADAAGRFWAGTTALDFAPNRGNLYVVEVDGTYRKVLENITLSNGMGWSPCNQYFYYIDSIPGVMKRFDFDLIKGTIANPVDLIVFDATKGIPDGMTVTNDGLLVVALWDGSRLEVFSAEGKKIDEIQLPVQRPTSCTFGGIDGATLIVTSSGQDLDLHGQPFNGKTLRVDGTGLSGAASRTYGALES